MMTEIVWYKDVWIESRKLLVPKLDPENLS